MNYKLQEYWKHTALNVGQAFRDLRYFYYHPQADKIAKEGTIKHYFYSVFFRIKTLWNNIYFSIIPPHWHHTAEDLKSMRIGSAREWFMHGYTPWTHPDPSRKK